MKHKICCRIKIISSIPQFREVFEFVFTWQFLWQVPWFPVAYETSTREKYQVSWPVPPTTSPTDTAPRTTWTLFTGWVMRYDSQSIIIQDVSLLPKRESVWNIDHCHYTEFLSWIKWNLNFISVFLCSGERLCDEESFVSSEVSTVWLLTSRERWNTKVWVLEKRKTGP